VDPRGGPPPSLRGASPIGGGDAHVGPVVNRRTRGSRRIDAGGVDLQKGVDQLARSVEQIEISLRRAERKIAADAEDRVRKLRTEASRHPNPETTAIHHLRIEK
jgi:hypothetical protein